MDFATSRTRYDRLVVPFREVYRASFGTPQTSSFVHDFSFDLTFQNQVTAEYPTRDWRRLIRDGDNACTELSGFRTGFTGTPHLFGGKKVYERPTFSRVSSPLTCDLTIHHPSDPVHNNSRHHVDSYSSNYWYLDTFSIDSVNLANVVENQARQRYINNLVKVQRKFDTLVFGGELRETISLILSPGKAVRKALDGHVAGFLKKGAPRRFPNFRSFRQYVQGKWLEFVFGVRPLLADINDGAEALASSIVDRVPNRKVTSSANGLVFQNFSGTPYNHQLGDSPFDIAFGTATLAYGIYTRYFGCVYNPAWENGLIASSLGIDWRNVAPAIYELIPYSFLVDYFLNLGGLINYYSYGTANVKWTNRTNITHSECYWNGYTVTPRPGQNIIDTFAWTPGSNRTYFIRRTVSRAPYAGSFYPGIQFGLPSLPQWLNIAALIDSSSKIYNGSLRGVRL